ncbi:MAG: hypothetical protein QM736_01525 [Vicinamibacterales bacterium]
MSRGEVVFTTAAVTGIVCVAAAAICVWVAVTDPAGLLSGASAGGATSVASLVVRAVTQVASAVLALVGW